MVAPGLLLEGRYRLDSRIATGGMGEVWRGTDLVLARGVAVKLLLPEYARDAEGAARFRAEARHAGMVSHPNIAQVFDYSEGDGDNDDTGRPYLVMELVDGPSLAGLLADGPLGPAYTLGVTAQVSAGLAAAHAADLVHRDIKPANLLISKDGIVKITDFGIAHAAGAAPVTRTGVVVGTGAYLAPERIAGDQAGPAADLYSLGVVAYECLTGKRPFNGDPLAVVLAHQEQPLPPLPPEVPERVAALVADLTAKDPGARPAGAAEVAARAEQLRAELAGITLTRPDLPVLAGAIINTGPQRTQGIGEVAGPHTRDIQLEDVTRQVSGLRPAAEASDGGAAGEPPPGGRRGLFGWIGPRTRTGLAAMVVVLAGLAVWMFAGLRGPAIPVRMTGGTRPVVRHTTSATPTHAGTSGQGTQPAVAPATQPAVAPATQSAVAPATQSASPSPSASAQPTQTQPPTQSPTPAPTRSAAPPPSPTPTGTRTGNSGKSGLSGAAERHVACGGRDPVRPHPRGRLACGPSPVTAW
jgi:eukaryotic-like serine/threonine-protein kinase